MNSGILCRQENTVTAILRAAGSATIFDTPPAIKKGTNPKVDAQFLTHGEVFLAAPIRGGAGEVLAQRPLQPD